MASIAKPHSRKQATTQGSSRYMRGVENDRTDLRQLSVSVMCILVSYVFCFRNISGSGGLSNCASSSVPSQFAGTLWQSPRVESLDVLRAETLFQWDVAFVAWEKGCSV